MDAIFQMVIHEYMTIPLSKLITLDIWDLEARKTMVKNFLNG